MHYIPTYESQIIQFESQQNAPRKLDENYSTVTQKQITVLKENYRVADIKLGQAKWYIIPEWLPEEDLDTKTKSGFTSCKNGSVPIRLPNTQNKFLCVSNLIDDDTWIDHNTNRVPLKDNVIYTLSTNTLHT
jgi:hypothetical protein